MTTNLFPLLKAIRPRTWVAGILCVAQAHGQTLEVLHPFSNEFNSEFIIPGNRPAAPLAQGSDGNFYGTTFLGGSDSRGSVFRMTPGGQVTHLFDFPFSDVADSGSKAGLVQAPDGNFYGTTVAGAYAFPAQAAAGTVFRITPQGVHSIVAEFSPLSGSPGGASPEAGLVIGGDGKLYGTTAMGGQAGFGTAFRVATTVNGGQVETLAHFSGTAGNNRGSRPRAALVSGQDGNFYGTCSEGGSQGHGTVFRMTPSGTLTTLVDFSDNDASNKGSRPLASLVLAGDGDFYGTTSEGGAFGHGTVFRMTPAGTLSTLIHFTGNGATNKGSRPLAALTPLTGGGFLGTTSQGGENGYGTVFRLAADGTLTTVAEFTPSGGDPRAPLVQGADGAYYGTTFGPFGITYRIVLSGRPKFLAQSAGGAFDDTRAFLQTMVNPSGSPTNVIIQYGTNSSSLILVFPVAENLTGISAEAVGITIADLEPDTQYFYRFVATNASGTTVSDLQSFTTRASVSDLSDLNRTYPAPPPAPSGFATTFNLSPPGVGGWRYAGETSWRSSGVPGGQNRSGTHRVEFRPVPGYIQPDPEFINEPIAPNIQSRSYFATAPSDGGSLSVILKPDSVAAQSVPAASRARWRFVGEDDTKWRDSRAAVAGLVPGTHLIEFKPVAGRITPSVVAVTLAENESWSRVFTYPAQDDSVGTASAAIAHSTVASDTSHAYAFVGQLRWDGGSGSGFAVTPRVVLTAAQNVFDDNTLAAPIGTEFLFRRDSASYEPAPLIPRASFILDDYATKRVQENTPGDLGLSSMNSNAASVYFDDDIDPSVRSGYLASVEIQNPFLLSSAVKTLVGYPVDGGNPAAVGRMHATPAANITFGLLHGRVFSTTGIRGGYGFAGAPLCVQQPSGFFPAAIHVGSHNGKTAVRAIDARVLELIDWADRDANGGSGPPTPGATLVSLTGNLNPTSPGSLKVDIEPLAARNAGAGWLIDPETAFRAGGVQKSGLAPGNYTVKLKTISGYVSPPDQTITVNGGQLTTVTYNYIAITPLDTWRFENFGTYENTGEAADSNDFDKDGETNLEEFTAGTHPKSAADVLKMTSPTKSGNTFTATCAGKAGRSYRLQRNTALSGIWTTVATQTTLSADQSLNLSDTAAPSGACFYRIEVTAP